MKYNQNEVMILNEQNKNNYNKKIISPNENDSLNSKETYEKKLIEQKNNSSNIKSSINNLEISTFKKEILRKPIKMYSNEEIINNMNIIFVNYAIYYYKKDLYLISIENIIKILREIGFLQDLIKLNELDILIKKICKKKKYIIFDEFMNIFIKIAQNAFPKEYKLNKDLLLNHFFHTIFSFYENILTKEIIPLKDILKYPYSSIISLMNIIPDDSQILVINSLMYTLNEIYERYFIYNVNINPDFNNNRSLSNFFDFCKDFEIFPFIFNNETQIIIYFFALTGKKDLFKLIDDSYENKNIFTFNNFILFFIHLSEYNYAKVYQNIVGDEKSETKLSKLIMLLTKLECSKGMRNIIETSLPNLSLMPNKELLLKYNFIFKKDSKTFVNIFCDDKREKENMINNVNTEKIRENFSKEKFENKDNLPINYYYSY